MKNPSWIAGTALIGIAIGFIAGSTRAERGTPSREEAAVSRRSGSTRRADVSARNPVKGESLASGSFKGREISGMSAAEVLALVKANSEINWGGDPLEAARKNYEYQLMLSKLPLAVLEEVMELSQESGIPGYRTRQIFSAYASRDLQKAMAWASTRPDAETWRGAAISATAANDPARAMEMFQEGILDGNYGTSGGNVMEGGYSLAGAFAKQGKDALLRFLDAMPSSGAGNLISNSVRNLPKEDLPAFMEEIEKRVKEGKVEQWTMSNLLQNLALTDPKLARSWIEKMEAGPERAKREISFAGMLSQQGKTGEALELVKSAMAQQPGKEKEFFMNEAGNLMYSNPNLISQVAASLPEGMELTVEDVRKLGERSGRTDLITMAKLLKSPDDQVSYLEESITKLGDRSRLNETDFRVLTYRLESLGLTGDGAASVQSALAASREKVLGKK